MKTLNDVKRRGAGMRWACFSDVNQKTKKFAGVCELIFSGMLLKKEKKYIFFYIKFIKNNFIYKIIFKILPTKKNDFCYWQFLKLDL